MSFMWICVHLLYLIGEGLSLFFKKKSYRLWGEEGEEKGISVGVIHAMCTVNVSCHFFHGKIHVIETFPF